MPPLISGNPNEMNHEIEQASVESKMGSQMPALFSQRSQIILGALIVVALIVLMDML